MLGYFWSEQKSDADTLEISYQLTELVVGMIGFPQRYLNERSWDVPNGE